MREIKKEGFLDALVWYAAPIRFLFEGMICIALFNASFYLFFNPAGRQMIVLQSAVFTLIVAIMIFIDRSIFCESLTKWEKSFYNAICGELNLAKQQLDSIVHSRFKPPSKVYHLRYAELLFMEGENYQANNILSKALNEGALGDECELIKLRGMLFSKENYKVQADSDCADKNMNTVDSIFEGFEGHSALIYLESAMINLFRLNNYRIANEQISLTQFMPPEMHPSYASTYDLCHLLRLCLGLHSGKADEVLSQLGSLLDFLKLQIGTTPSLRPYLSFAYLERAKYYARRVKTRSKSQADIDLALAICRYPAHLEISRTILC